jgi:hypothetical protein
MTVVTRHVLGAGVGDPVGSRVDCWSWVIGYAALGSMVTLLPRTSSSRMRRRVRASHRAFWPVVGANCGFRAYCGKSATTWAAVWQSRAVPQR